MVLEFPLYSMIIEMTTMMIFHHGLVLVLVRFLAHDRRVEECKSMKQSRMSVVHVWKNLQIRNFDQSS
jgi:hypothetical protein